MNETLMACSFTFNFENIHYFPGCSSATILLPHSVLHFPLDICKPGGGEGLPYEEAKDARVLVVLASLDP